MVNVYKISITGYSQKLRAITKLLKKFHGAIGMSMS